MIEFDPKKPYGEVFGPGGDCRYIQDGRKYDGGGGFVGYQKGREPKELLPEAPPEPPEPRESEACPYCGKRFKKVTSHLRWCKVKKAKEKGDGRNAGKSGGQTKRNEPETMASGRSQTSYIIGRLKDS